jgi:hypothetical protein
VAAPLVDAAGAGVGSGLSGLLLFLSNILVPASGTAAAHLVQRSALLS